MPINKVIKKINNPVEELFSEPEVNAADEAAEDFGGTMSPADSDLGMGFEELGEDDDLFVVRTKKYQARLPEGPHRGVVGKISIERKPQGINGPWYEVTIPFVVTMPNGDTVTVTRKVSTSLHPKSHLYPIVEAIMGEVPEGDFDLRELQGREAIIITQPWTDGSGNTWDHVVEVRSPEDLV